MAPEACFIMTKPETRAHRAAVRLIRDYLDLPSVVNQPAGLQREFEELVRKCSSAGDPELGASLLFLIGLSGEGAITIANDALGTIFERIRAGRSADGCGGPARDV
jgi:hypothetical protein